MRTCRFPSCGGTTLRSPPLRGPGSYARRDDRRGRRWIRDRGCRPDTRKHRQLAARSRRVPAARSSSTGSGPDRPSVWRICRGSTRAAAGPRSAAWRRAWVSRWRGMRRLFPTPGSGGRSPVRVTRGTAGLGSWPSNPTPPSLPTGWRRRSPGARHTSWSRVGHIRPGSRSACSMLIPAGPDGGEGWQRDQMTGRWVVGPPRSMP